MTRYEYQLEHDTAVRAAILVTVLLEYFVWQILKLCDRLNRDDSTKILVIGSWVLLRRMNINGRRVNYHEALKHYSKQGLYFFVKLHRYTV